MYSTTIAIYSLILVALIPFLIQLGAERQSEHNANQPTFFATLFAAQHQYLYISLFFIAAVLTAQTFVVPQILINRLAMLFLCFHCAHLLSIALKQNTWALVLRFLSLTSPLLLMLLSK